MPGCGINTKLSGVVNELQLRSPAPPALVDFPLDQYGLNRPSVLDAIARLAAARRNNPVRAYNPGGRSAIPEISVSGISELFWHSKQLGCTFNIEYLERYIPEVCAFANDLTGALGATVAVHAFVSGGGVPASPLHYDYSDAFTVQLYGSKLWQCSSYRDKPTYGPGGYVVDATSVGQVLLNHVLQPAECLFVPKGELHQATALPDQDSVHLAVSIEPLTRQKYFEQVLDPGLEDPGWASGDFSDHAQQSMRALQIAATAASRGDVARIGKNAIWHFIYRAYNTVPYARPPKPNAERRRLERGLGWPLSVARDDGVISVEYLDAKPGPVGTSAYGFHPSRIELPLEAEPFAAMLEAGLINVDELASVYDADTVADLLDLSAQLGFTN